MAKRMKEKTAKRIAEKDNRPQALAKYIRISPPKVRVVLDLIRGKDYFTALGILQNTQKRASEAIIKVLESAGANAENNQNLSKNDLYVAECYANEGMTMKRYWYRSHGSADIIKKRTSHIKIILDEKKDDDMPVKKATKKAEAEVKQAEVKQEEKTEAKTTKTTKPAKTETKKVASTTTTKKSADKTVKTKKDKTQEGGEK